MGRSHGWSRNMRRIWRGECSFSACGSQPSQSATGLHNIQAKYIEHTLLQCLLVLLPERGYVLCPLHLHTPHAPSCTFMHLHAPSCTFMHLHAPTYTCMHLHAPACMHLHTPHTPACTCMHLHACTCIHLHAPTVPSYLLDRDEVLQRL